MKDEAVTQVSTGTSPTETPSHAGTPASASQLDLAKYWFEHVKHEDSITNSRLASFLQLHGILFAAYGFTAATSPRNPHQLLAIHIVFAAFGLLTAVPMAIGFQATHKVLKSLSNAYRDAGLDRIAGFPDLRWQGTTFEQRLLGFSPSAVFCVFAALAWLAILCVEVRWALYA